MAYDWTLVKAEILLPYALRFARVLLLLGLAYILSKLLSRVVIKIRIHILKAMEERAEGSIIELQKRAATVGGIFRKTAAVVIWTVAIMMALREVGFDVGPLIAGAGIVGVAVGFGAQSLVRDVIGGVFLLLENQVRINDVVQINGTGGLVEEINLRTIVLRGLDGAVHIFPNGTIQTLSNLTREFSYYLFDIGIPYKEDTDRVCAVLREVAEQMREEPKWAAMIREPLDILGVDKFADSGVILKARIKTGPIQQWAVGRELNRRFKKKFDETGIQIPFPQVTLSFLEPLKVPGVSREELKSVVREVLAEAGIGRQLEQPKVLSPQDASAPRVE